MLLHNALADSQPQPGAPFLAGIRRIHCTMASGAAWRVAVQGVMDKVMAAPLVGQGADAINGLLHQVVNLAEFHDQLNFAGFKPFKAEDVIHQARQAIAVVEWRYRACA